ncbi:MAG TPA: radical SAM protein [Desulfobacteraceae bacterium]|nr:radical SAM protein [Desulfobacteraceae bacterium]
MALSKASKMRLWTMFIDTVVWISHKKAVMNFLIKKAEGYLWNSIVQGRSPSIRPAQELKYYFVRNLMRSTQSHLRSGIMSREVFQKMVKVFVRNVFVEDISKREIRTNRVKDMVYPSFLVLSPTQRCNLYCTGCYAVSSSRTKASLPYEIVSRILREKVELWGSRFTVISGGEPFLWKEEGKDIVDLAKERSDNFFMIYTNGTMIDREMALRLADAGNITPAISVEGFEEKTDARRGRGVFKKILKAFENLRDAGVPFGISVEATKENWDEVSSREFLNFFFDQQGVFYGWLFQYMPIGRSYTLEAMVSAEQRKELFRRNVAAIKDGYSYIDFWNQGVMTDGCLAAGRNGGYLYIDWHGNVMPCVFIPYYSDNILEIYKRGGNLNDILYSPFFKKIREWQNEYALKRHPKDKDNLILPCPIRDHHEVIYELLHKSRTIKASDREAEICLKDYGYHQGLFEYDRELRKALDPVWEQEYRSKVV